MLAGKGILQLRRVNATGRSAPHVFDQLGVFGKNLVILVRSSLRG